MEYIINVTTAILKGGKITLELYAITAVFSVPLGVLCALGKVSGIKMLKSIIGVYTWVFRGTPLLLQLFFVYYGLPTFNIKLNALSAAGLTFTLNYGAYLTEIFRAGIESIDKGQYEAAKVLGLNYRQTMARIILPQTIKRVIPPAANEAITLIKDTALVAAISMPDLLVVAKQAVTRDFTITPFGIAAVLYLIITSVIVFLFGKLEKRYSIHE